MYAVIDRGGKQMRVEEGQVLEVDRLAEDAGAEVVLGRVLMVVDADQVRCGTPVVDGARVTARVLSHGRMRKVIVGKFRPKKHYRRRVGHRQPLSRVRIERIDVAGGADRGA
ncbi:MAG TPA: 50S ribosomal protein L21 [bacterium]|nr:50S ribosomal protein L21 [bacterium]